jgi:ribose/xylose/arabinose/galactoside ABC-type transport system permease subunit
LRGVLFFYLALVIYFWAVADHFMTYANWIDVISTASVVLIVSLGQALTIISGGFDLSVGGVVPLGAVVFAELTSHGIPALPSLLLVIAVGVAVGIFNAFVVGQLGVNPMIATLGTLSVTGGIAFTIANGVTVQLPASAGFLANNGPWFIPYYVFVAIGVSILVHLLLTNTVLGRRIYVVGGNAEAARLAGISVGGVQLAVYGLSGALAALAGVIYASQLLAAAGDVGSDLTLTSIAAVVLGGAALTGGIGGVPGTLLGVLVLGTLSDGMNLMRMPAFYQTIVTGAVLLAAVGFAQVQGRLLGRRS